MSSGKNVIFLGVGVVVGGVIGSFVTRMVLKKKCEQTVDAEINEFLANFYKENKENSGELTEKTEDSEADGGLEVGKMEENSGNAGDFEAYSARNMGDSALDYRSFYKTEEEKASVDPAEMEYPMDETDEEIEEREELIRSGGLVTDENRSDIWCEETTAEMNSGKKPRLITSESYDDEYPHFDKIELEYYTVDDVLVDISAEEEIADPERIVGDCLDKYGFRTNDDERVIFVRNFNHGADYEISKVFGRFYSD